MPPLPSVPNVVKTQIGWLDAGDANVTSTNYWQYSGDAPDGATCNLLAADLLAAVVEQRALWTPSTHLLSVICTDLSDPDSGQGTAVGDSPGTRTGADLAGGTCCLVNYTINRRYRGGKPRNYFPWGSATDLASRQSWGTTFTNAATAAIQAITAGFVGSDENGTAISNHVNVSYYQGFTVEGGTGGKRAKNVSTPRATPLVGTILLAAASTTPGSQRRRNRG